MAIPIKVSCSGVAYLDGLLDPQPSNQADSMARETPGNGPDWGPARLCGISRGGDNKTSVRGERNAYRPERVPSGDGLRRAPEDLQAVHQAHTGDHCRRGCAD